MQFGGGADIDDAPDYLNVLPFVYTPLAHCVHRCMTQRIYLWSLLGPNLLDNELLVRRNISEELGNRPVVTDPQLVCGTGDESLVVRDTNGQLWYLTRDDMAYEMTPPLNALTAAIKASIPSISK